MTRARDAISANETPRREIRADLRGLRGDAFYRRFSRADAARHGGLGDAPTRRRAQRRRRDRRRINATHR